MKKYGQHVATEKLAPELYSVQYCINRKRESSPKHSVHRLIIFISL